MALPEKGAVVGCVLKPEVWVEENGGDVALEGVEGSRGGCEGEGVAVS